MSRFAQANKFTVTFPDSDINIECQKIPMNRYFEIAEKAQSFENKGDGSIKEAKNMIPFFQEIVLTYSDINESEIEHISAGDLVFLALQIMRKSSPKGES